MRGVSHTFETTIEAVASILRPEALRPERALNVSVADAVLVGLAHRLEKGPIGDPPALRAANDRLIDSLKQEELYKTGTTNKDRVEKRIELAWREYGVGTVSFRDRMRLESASIRFFKIVIHEKWPRSRWADWRSLLRCGRQDTWNQLVVKSS